MDLHPTPTGGDTRPTTLAAYDILDTPPDPAFDDLVRVAARLLRVPIALVSLADGDRFWFKARVGLDASEVPRSQSFCQHALSQSGPLIVPDAREDPRFADNPLVTGAPHIRFYASAPLVAPAGQVLGSFCAIDRVPRRLTPDQRDALAALSRQAVAQMELRLRTAELARRNAALGREAVERARAEAQYRDLFENAAEGIFRSTPAGRLVLANPALARLVGYGTPAEMAAAVTDVRRHLYADPERRADFLRLMEADGRVHGFQMRARRRDGGVIWASVSGRAVRDVTGEVLYFEGSVQDVTERKQGEEALRERTGLLETVLAAVPHHVFWKDADSVYRGCNVNFARACGLASPEQVVGLSDHDLPWTPAEAAGYLALDRRVLAGGAAVVNEEQTARRADGTVITGLTSKIPLRGGDGSTVGVLGVFHDITERKAAESALRETERQRRTLTDNVPVLIARVGADRRYVFANRAYEALLGVPLGRVVGHTMAEVLGDDAYATIRPYVDRVLAGEAVQYDAALNYRTVGERFVHGSYVPEFGPRGEVTGFILSAVDITERQRMAETLREQTEVLGNVLSTIPHQVFWKGRDLTYLGCNPNFARDAGLGAPEDVVGKSDYDLAWTPEEARSYRRDDRRVLDTGATISNLEETYTYPDGASRVGLTSKLPLHDAQGRIIGVLGISQDITERKGLEAEREALLEETGRLLTEALDRADHDPLTGLLNHRSFHRRLEEESERVRRDGGALAVAMLDLDNFKFFNDAYGHLVGDEVLRRVADALRGAGGPCHTLARFGGDEFAVLAPGADDMAALMDRLVTSLKTQGFRPPGYDTPIPLSASVGMAVLPLDAATRLEALELADARLRLTKSGAGEEAFAAQRLRAHLSGSVEGFPMLDALVTAVDNKDRYTRRHSEDVMTYSLLIARELGLGERALQMVAVAALIHDVGKIGVPDAILRKPAGLTGEELEAVRQHPQMGAAIVSAVPGLEDTLGAVRHHHERWDGRGYPEGLQGEETPLLARLMAVADAYSAMTTDRPYRQALGREEALSLLAAGAGTQWDPACVRAFLAADARP